MKLSQARSAWLLLLRLPSSAANHECQPSTWYNDNHNRQAVPTGVMEVFTSTLTEIATGEEQGDLLPGDINCRLPGRTFDVVNYYSCANLAETYSINLDHFFTLNPTLEPDCSNIQPNTEYCVRGYMEPVVAWDGLCGPAHNDATCYGTDLPCCNANTFTCGATEADCAPGTCYEGGCAGDAVYSTDGTCGPDHGERLCAGVQGDCCSMAGQCGTGVAFCGEGNCRSGECVEFVITTTTESTATSTSTTTSATTPTPTPPLIVDGFRMLGCFAENSGIQRVLDYDSMTSSQLTLESCKYYCVEQNGYPFWGVEWGQECWCGWRRGETTSLAASEAECDMACGGDSTQTCGGDQRINVFGPEDTPDHVWLGCRTDTDPAGPALDARSFPSSAMTNELCESQCTAWGPYDYFGTQAGSSCRCGNTLRASSQVTPLSDCSASCLGDTQSSCGGQQSLTVFGPNFHGPTPIYQGWFTDDDPVEWALGSEPVWSDDGNTVEECAWHCFYQDSGYDLFGVEDGGYCMCGYNLHHDSYQVSDSECSTPCTGDSSKPCGGDWRLSFYWWDWSKYYGASGGSFARSAASAPTTPSRGPKMERPAAASYAAVTERIRA